MSVVKKPEEERLSIASKLGKLVEKEELSESDLRSIPKLITKLYAMDGIKPRWQLELISPGRPATLHPLFDNNDLRMAIETAFPFDERVHVNSRK